MAADLLLPAYARTCCAAMFWPIGTRLQGGKLGMEVFAVGNALLGLAYVLQLRVTARLADGA